MNKLAELKTYIGKQVRDRDGVKGTVIKVNTTRRSGPRSTMGIVITIDNGKGQIAIGSQVFRQRGFKLYEPE